MGPNIAAGHQIGTGADKPTQSKQSRTSPAAPQTLVRCVIAASKFLFAGSQNLLLRRLPSHWTNPSSTDDSQPHPRTALPDDLQQTTGHRVISHNDHNDHCDEKPTPEAAELTDLNFDWRRFCVTFNIDRPAPGSANIVVAYLVCHPSVGHKTAMILGNDDSNNTVTMPATESDISAQQSTMLGAVSPEPTGAADPAAALEDNADAEPSPPRKKPEPKLCGVCGTQPGKYKCPRCSLP